jgi:Short C-terminal domain
MMRRRPLARMAVRTTVVAGTAAAVGAHAANKRNASEQEAAAPQAPPPPPPPAAAAPDPIEQLTQLAALKDSGALTEAEFETQKARILG